MRARVSGENQVCRSASGALDRVVVITMQQVDVPGLDEVVAAMQEWAIDGLPVQLHVGDVGWQARFGDEATAAALRTWRRDDRIVAVGFVDSPGVLRMALAPDAGDDDELAARLLADLADPSGVLPAGDAGDAVVEARYGDALRAALTGAGWQPDEPWTPLVRDLTDPVEDSGLRVVVVGPEEAEARVAVQRAAFERSVLTVDAWRGMTEGPAYADARCLLGYDDAGRAVAAATVWGAGPGRQGLLEPVGVHCDHRGHGHGRAIAIAAAAALREMGASSALVCTRSANVAAVATYRSSGMRELPAVPDLRRPSA